MSHFNSPFNEFPQGFILYCENGQLIVLSWGVLNAPVVLNFSLSC
jgi:hypothetical protein